MKRFNKTPVDVMLHHDILPSNKQNTTFEWRLTKNLNEFGKLSWYLCLRKFIFWSFMLYAFFICDQKSKHTLTHLHLSAQVNYANGILSMCMLLHFSTLNSTIELRCVSLFFSRFKMLPLNKFHLFHIAVRKMFIRWFLKKKKSW